MQLWFYLVKNYQKFWLVLSLVLIISGGIGNFIDRLHPLVTWLLWIQLDFVIDFCDICVADSYLTVGVALDFNLMEEENGSHH